MLGCEQVSKEDLNDSPKNELKSEKFSIKYEEYEVQAQILPATSLTKADFENSMTYDLVLNSEFLKTPVVTQIVQKINADGSFVLVHYVEGVRVATLYYNVAGDLLDIEVEEIPNTRAAWSFLDCVTSKYSQLKKDMEGSLMEIIVDCGGPVSVVALAATAGADCAGMFEHIGIK